MGARPWTDKMNYSMYCPNFLRFPGNGQLLFLLQALHRGDNLLSPSTCKAQRCSKEGTEEFSVTLPPAVKGLHIHFNHREESLVPLPLHPFLPCCFPACWSLASNCTETSLQPSGASPSHHDQAKMIQSHLAVTSCRGNSPRTHGCIPSWSMSLYMSSSPKYSLIS